MKRLILIGLCLFLSTGVFAQTQVQPTPSPSSSAPGAPTSTPAPAGPIALDYTDKEFPDWALKVRRAEIIAVGAFPIAYLLCGLSYDYVYFSANGFPQSNVPWPAGPGTSQWTTTDQPDLVRAKSLTLVGASAGLSLLIAFADWLLGLSW